ncbi:MAG: hypothetical protein KDD64_17345, partial [Bdellovibrionales bacterium]|nr:hypothetical protein [Bdellovibrionales bacterium]
MRQLLFFLALWTAGYSLQRLILSPSLHPPPNLETLEQALSFSVEQTHASTGELVRISRDLYRLSTTNVSAQEQIELLCKSLAVLGKIVEADPLSSAHLIGWAAQRALLGSIRCSYPLTDGDVSAVVRFALDHDPRKAERYLTAARVFRLLGEDSKSQEYLRDYFSELGRRTPAQKELPFLLVEISSPELFLKVVPPSLFTVVWWTKILEERSRSFPEWGEALDKYQRDVVQLEIEKVDRPQTEKDLLRERVLDSLSLLVTDDRIRRTIDQILSYEMDRASLHEQAEYFALRSRLSRREVAVAFEPGDLTPHRAPLARWTTEKSVTFNRYFTTIGFFSTEEIAPVLIELSSLRN